MGHLDLIQPLPYGPCVRLRTTFGPVAPFTDVLVEVKDPSQPKGWREVARFNDESPTAVSDADVCARGVRRTLRERERV